MHQNVGSSFNVVNLVLDRKKELIIAVFHCHGCCRSGNCLRKINFFVIKAMPVEVN